MIRKRVHEAATVSTRRLEAFTDGVFAIAATLLVLELTTTQLGHPRTDAQLWENLGSMGSQFLGFVISFLLLCLLWSVHVQQFEHIVRVDDTTLWLNTLRLLGVVLIPLSTSITGEFSDLVSARVLMPINFLWIVTIGYVQWIWATRPAAPLTEGVDAAAAKRIRRAGLSALILGAVAVALSPFFGSWAFAAYAFDPLLSRMLGGSNRTEGP